MDIITTRTFSRVGLIGNPSDGYNGKTVSAICSDFYVDVILYQWPYLEIIPTLSDLARFDNLPDLVNNIQLNGYYGGVRIIKATIKIFADYCRAQDIPLDNKNFTLRYASNIPRSVGLAGSSAIVIGTLKGLMQFYQVSIPEHILPSLALKVETDELNIPCGLQDRVIQVYGGMVAMDFSKENMGFEQGLSFGRYRRIDPGLYPPLYMAYDTRAGEPTEVTHSDLRTRYSEGEVEVVRAMQQFASLTDQTLAALGRGDHQEVSRLMNANFDLRRSICRIPPRQLAMVDKARTVGASAKFAGSGGAIVGCYQSEEIFQKLVAELGAMGCSVLKLKF